MKLLNLSIRGEYKGLNNQSFDFSGSSNIIAMVGLNGSGKSQLLEVICETFSYLERVKRREFRVRTSLGFGISAEYAIRPYVDATENTIHKVVILEDGLVSSYRLADDAWQSISVKDLNLPEYVVGYSSGLNENLQRSFLKNSLQFYQVMSTRAARRKRLAEDLDERGVADVNKFYLRRHSGIFNTPTGQETLNGGYLSLGESDTRAPSMIFLDYDCNALLMASLGILSRHELNTLLPELRFKYPRYIEITYDLRNMAVEEDAIRDIRQLTELAQPGNIVGISPIAGDEDYDLYGLDYLSATIIFDFGEEGTHKSLSERYFGIPLRLFERLYKIQLLGVKHWNYKDRINLRSDNFVGNVKKPLKTKLPLSISKLKLADDDGVLIDFDDLSDGEAQLIQVIGGSRIFRDENTLFVLDEPETHLNPSWRTHFHRHLSLALDAATSEEGAERQRTQVLLSTHSPFLVSSLHKEDVFNFERTDNNTFRMVPSYIQTYGAAFEVLIKQFFGLRSLISQTAVDDIKAHIESLGDAEARRWIEENIGDSMERSYLLRKLRN